MPESGGPLCFQLDVCLVQDPLHVVQRVCRNCKAERTKTWLASGTGVARQDAKLGRPTHASQRGASLARATLPIPMSALRCTVPTVQCASPLRRNANVAMCHAAERCHGGPSCTAARCVCRHARQAAACRARRLHAPHFRALLAGHLSLYAAISRHACRTGAPSHHDTGIGCQDQGDAG